MKANFLKLVVLLAFIAVVSTGCRDRNAEKRIAALENEIRELKGTKTAEPVSATPAEAEP